MQTGATLSLYFQQKISASYTGYLDNTKKNRLFKNALISVVERVYRSDYEIKQWDEITFVTNTDVTKVPSYNCLLTSNLKISSVAIYSATSFLITTTLPHKLVTGQAVTVSGVTGTLTMNTANGSFGGVVVAGTYTFIVNVASATGVHAANTGVATTPATISDYWHLLAIKCKFNTPVPNLEIEGATNRSPIVLTVNNRNIIRTGVQVVVSGVTGNTAANGTYYVKIKNDFSMALYSDPKLLVPVVGNGNYVSGGTIAIQNINYASPLTSKMKQGVLNTPSVRDPYFEIAANEIKIYPTDQVYPGYETCSQVNIDYIRIPPVVIDVADNVIDLTLYYPEKFLFAIVDEAAVLYGAMSRDPELFQESNIEQQKNP